MTLGKENAISNVRVKSLYIRRKDVDLIWQLGHYAS